MNYRNLLILIFCQMISATGSFVIVTLGGILGKSLAANPAYATFAVSLMVIGVAATAIPAAMLMKRIGRKRGFAVGSLAAFLAMLLAAYALSIESFGWFVVSAGLLGMNMAFTQQYRYAATECVEQKFVGRAVSFVLIGAIGGALIGPEFVTRGQYWIADVPFAGTVLAVSALYVLQFILLSLLGPFHSPRGQDQQQQQDKAPRPLRAIISQPVFLIAVLSGTAAYGVMSLIMTATPISMHVNDGFSIDQTTRVISVHVLGMYLPSLFSGWLLDRFGNLKVMSVGVAALIVASLIGLHDRSLMHYWFALVSLGVGWNFLYVGATTTLTLTYSMSERFKTQAVNEFSVFGTAATASLIAGVIMHGFGWTTLVLLPLPVLLTVLIGLFVFRKDPLLGRSPVPSLARASESKAG